MNPLDLRVWRYRLEAESSWRKVFGYYPGRKGIFEQAMDKLWAIALSERLKFLIYLGMRIKVIGIL